MQHEVLLGRDNRIRFNTRSYRALPPRADVIPQRYGRRIDLCRRPHS